MKTKAIILIKEDNSINIIENNDAQKYVDFYNNLCVLASNRAGNQNPYSKPENKLNWKTVSKEELINLI